MSCYEDNIFMCMSDVFVHVYVCRYMYMYVCMHVAWLPEVDLGCLPQLLFTVLGGVHAKVHTWRTYLRFCG